MTLRFRRPFILLVFSLLTLPLLTSASPAAAQSRSVFWERWDVTIDNIDTTANRFDVTESYDVDFTGSFRFGSAVIANENLEDITNVQVFEEGQPLQQSCSERAGTFCVQDVDEGLSIVYYFTNAASNESREFEISYTVEGALRVYEDGDQLWWIAVPEEKFGFAVGESTITVELPDQYRPREGVDPVETYGTPATITVQGSTITAVAESQIAPNDTFEIRVQYPHDSDARVANWQSNFDQQRQLEPIINLAVLALGLLIGLGGPFGVFYVWYSRGRDPKVGVVPEYLSELPSDLPPGVVGALIDEKADLRDVLSTLIDLSRRGYIVIEESQTEGLFGLGGRSDFTFKRTDKSFDDLRGYERRFAEKLFGGAMERTMDSLKNKFYVHIPGLQRDIYNELVDANLFAANPDSTRNGWSAIGLIILFASGALFFFAIGNIETAFRSLIFLPIAGAITGVLMMIAAQFMPAKTQQGAEEAAKWKAFYRYLQNLENYKTLEEAQVNFETFLPYAVAFGMERSWIRRFSQLPAMPIPTWYFPTYRGGYWGRGYRAGTPLGRGMSGDGLPSANDVLPGDIARAGGGGLNDVAGNLSGGLESMSAGLTNMLNSAGSVMTSRPQSSGSSGRWSSGGRSWSGGGSFGGGGSGGGSRGFG
jgi:uncharacterized membrane protein